jgi:tetratricopeptide (TPR) repeat protein
MAMPSGKNRHAPGRKRNQSNARQSLTKREKLPLSPQPAAALFKEAEKLFAHNRFEEVVAKLESSTPDSEWLGQKEELGRTRLLALALSHLGQHLEAERYARRGLEIAPDEGDFHFVLAITAAAIRDYDPCIENGQRCLELTKNVDQRDSLKDAFSAGYHHLLYNHLGIAHRAKNDFLKAEQAFRAAIEKAPHFNHPYLNLANLYLQRKEYDKASEIVKSGLRNCSQIQEFRILEKVIENRATVSACMIVKDEEELLPQCLESIRSWVDEIIIVDTGSTDRTVEIAQSYGARIFFQPWKGDFSGPRNLSLSKATGDWIFVIDADEEFVQDDIPLIRQVMAQDKFRLISINVYNTKKETGECTSFLPSYRLYKREAGFYYDGIVHNQLKYDPAEPALRVGIRLKHYGYSLSPQKMKKKIARSRELLERQLAEYPNDPYVHFNYAQLLRGTGTELPPDISSLIIEHARRAIELTDRNDRRYLHVHLMAHHQLITTFLHLKRYAEAEKLCREALDIKPDYLDPLLSLGQVYIHLGRWKEAEEAFQRYLEIQQSFNESKETANIILLYVRARHIAYYGLGLVAHIKGEAGIAENWYLKVLKEFGPYLDTHLRLARLHLDRLELDKGRQYLEKELAINPGSDICCLYLAEYYARSGNLMESEIWLKKALELTEDRPEIYEKAGCFYTNSGRHDRAIPLFKKLVDINSQYTNGLRLLGKAFYDNGDYSEALESYLKFLDREASNSEILNDAANCYFQMNDFAKAENYYQRALDAKATRSVTYRNLGLTKFHLGKYEEALTLFDKYGEIVPDDVDLTLAKGLTLVRMDRFSDAIPHFERYLATHPESIEGLFNISECYFCLGYVDSAAIGYKHVLQMNPGHQPSLERLSQIRTEGVTA